MAQCPEFHRYRLRIAEQESGMREQEKARQQDRAKHIDVAQGVGRNASRGRGGVVAEMPRRIAMLGFVQRNRDDDGDRDNRNLFASLNRINHVYYPRTESLNE